MTVIAVNHAERAVHARIKDTLLTQYIERIRALEQTRDYATIAGDSVGAQLAQMELDMLQGTACRIEAERDMLLGTLDNSSVRGAK